MSKKKNTTVTKISKAAEPVVVNQIVVKAPTRKVYDVGDWRNALRSADSGRVKSLYDLFEDVLIDGVLADAVSKRIDAVLNSELTFLDKDGKEVEEITTIMDTTDWEELLRQIMNERIYGRSGVEFICTPDSFHVEPIPAKHINLRNKCIVINDSDDKGVPYEGDTSLLILGHERSYGLLLKATPFAIYKRGGFGDWSQWIELFGMPQRIGKYNTYDPESRKLLEQALEQAGSASYVVIPREAEVETKEAGKGNGASYNEFRQSCNEEMLITILGQTLTTVQGENGARSLGEVHKEVEEGKNRSDMRFVQRVLNNHVLPLLEARGYPVNGGKFIFPKAAEQLTVADIVQLSDIMPIPQSYLHEKYSIPVPENDEPIARRQAAAFDPVNIDGGNGTAAVQNIDGGAVPTNSTQARQRAEASFFRRLRDFFVAAPTTMGANSKSQSPTNLGDDTLDNRLIKRVANGTAAYFDAELFEYLSKDLLNAIHKAFKRPVNNADFAYTEQDDALTTAMEQNLFHFSAAKTLAEIQKLNQLYHKAKTFEEFSKEASKVCGKFNKVWQKTEYETALLTAEAAANYQRLYKKRERFPYWQYVTAGDEKVREEHRKLDGVTLLHSDPRWDKIYPPNGWKCRCHVVPRMRNEVNNDLIKKSQDITDDYMQSDEWEKIKATHFDSNVGKRQHVFNNNQMYVRKFPTKAAKLMEKVTPDDWGLKHSYKQLIRDAKQKVNEYKGTPEEWWDKQKHIELERKVRIPVTDYNGRKWYMAEDKFYDHTHDKKKKRSFRVKFLNCIDETLKDPDEVWLGKDEKDQQTKDPELTEWRYIKYYDDVAVVCVCKIQNTMKNFKTWYLLNSNEIRKGLLIYRK